MNFTRSQKVAINTTNQSLSVNAGAGSGKTTVLVSRYIRLIAERKVDITGILAITFTNKSALDLRQKVRSYINEQIHQAEDLAARDYWKGILNRYPNAMITTFHGFAFRVLQAHPIEAKLHPQTQLIDETQTRIILEHSIDEVLVNLAPADRDLRRMIADMRSGRQAVKQLSDLYQNIRSLGGTVAESANKALNYSDQAERSFQHIKEALILATTRALEFIKQDKPTKKFVQKWLDAPIAELMAELSVLTFESKDRSQMDKILSQLKELCKGRAGRDYSDLVKEIYSASANSGLVVELSNVFAYFQAIPLWQALEKLLIAIDAHFTQAKRAQRYVDFSDLEWGLKQLWEDNPELLNQYQKKYPYVMVDEFQDTSPLQQELVQMIAPLQSNGLFIVGDPRQSIYRFRAAEVEGFQRMNERIEKEGGQRLILPDNFRSHTSLVRFYNHFFQDLFDSTPITYDPTIAGRQDVATEARAQLWIPSAEYSKEFKNTAELRALEAQLIASNISHMLASHQISKFGDVAILLRALTDIGTYEEALKSQKIPYIVVGSRGFFERQEILDLLNIMNYLANPTDQIALVGILRSPAFGISDEGLYRLQIHCQLKLGTSCSELNEWDQQQWSKASHHLEKWHNTASVVALSAALLQVLDDVQLPAVYLGLAHYGSQAVANIDYLIEMIMELEHQGTRSVTRIMEYLETLIQNEPRLGDAPSPVESANAVLLMSVHQSKGLDFHTVILPNCDRGMVKNGLPAVSYSRDYGLLVQRRDYFDQLQTNSYCDQAVQFERQKELEESYRLLYVAATRAKERLIFSACPKSWPKENNESWLNLIANYAALDEYPTESGQPTTELGLRVFDAMPSACMIDEETVIADSHLQPSQEGIPLSQDLPMQKFTGVSLSLTALQSYLTCPRHYYYRYIQRIPPLTIPLDEGPRQTDWAELGTLIHRVCELAKTSEAVKKIWADVLAQADLDSDIALEYRKLSDPWLQRYSQSALMGMIQKASRVWSEISFSFNYEEFVLRGIIDKVISWGNQLTLIDYKSGWLHEATRKKYLLQMAIYALVIAKQERHYPDSLIVYSMRNGATDYTDLLPDRASCHKVIDDILEQFRNDRLSNFQRKSLDHCENCAYKAICTR